MSSDEDAPLSDARREELLDRVQRRGSTIGEQIPESVTIGGTEMNLREFVWETKKQGVVPPDKRERVREVRTSLKRERDRLKDRLKSADLTVAEGEHLTETIVGIDRAIAALKNLREPDLQAQSHEQRIESNRRWVQFLDNILK